MSGTELGIVPTAPEAAPPAEADESEGPRPSKATRAMGYIEGLVTAWYADRDGTGYVDAVEGIGPRRTLRVRSTEMRRLLRSAMYDAEAVGLSGEAMTEAVETLDARACAAGTVRDVRLRVASAEDGSVWLDLGGDDWRAVQISPRGWRIVDSHDVPARFRRGQRTRALPDPARGGSLSELRDHVRVRDDHLPLVVAWLLGTLLPGGPYAILDLVGEQGTSKSTTARRLLSLTDPTDDPLRRPPRDDRELRAMLAHTYLPALDNLSHLPEWLSDDLCRVATGGYIGGRTLYTDDDESGLHVCRPLLLTGISDVAVRGDLADRCYVVPLEPIPDAERRTERDLDAAWEAARPRILGALLDAAVVGLARLDHPEVLGADLPRMADAARWALACEPACPWEPGGYLLAIGAGRADAARAYIDGDPVAAAIVDHLDAEGGEWTGTASELLAALDARRVPRDGGETGRRPPPPPKGWPTTARAMSGRLDRAAPALRRVGVDIERSREADSGRRLIALTRPGPAPDPDPSGTGNDRHDRHDRHGTDRNHISGHDIGAVTVEAENRDGRDGRGSTVTPTVTDTVTVANPDSANGYGWRPSDRDGRDGRIPPLSAPIGEPLSLDLPVPDPAPAGVPAVEPDDREEGGV